MSTLIIGHGPGGSGKTTAAREWQRKNPDRILIDEGNLSPVMLDVVVQRLNEGHDVWLNVALNAQARLSLDIPGHTVEMRPFVRDEEVAA